MPYAIKKIAGRIAGRKQDINVQFIISAGFDPGINECNKVSLILQ